MSIVRNLEEKIVGKNGKSPKQGQTSAKVKDSPEVAATPIPLPKIRLNT